MDTHRHTHTWIYKEEMTKPLYPRSFTFTNVLASSSAACLSFSAALRAFFSFTRLRLCASISASLFCGAVKTNILKHNNQNGIGG
jgi:hypothetical protein